MYFPNRSLACALSAGLLALAAGAQTPVKPASGAPATAVKLDAHVKEDIQRHRAMALAHENAARCLESGRTESQCGQELQTACKGLAIGKYCGMKHEH